MKDPVTIGDATLYCGDCLEILPRIRRDYAVDSVITDPPYGISHKSNGQIFKGAEQIQGDEDTWAYGFLVTLAPCVVAFFSPYQHPGMPWRSVLVWDKGGHVGGGGDPGTCWKRDHECIGVLGNQKLNGQRDSSVLRYNALLPPPTGHFCEKPVPLMEYLISKINAPTVLDPFMGSGTTGVACANLGRKFIGIEIEPKYFDIACERIDRAYAQGRLFA